jgi:hypothetical protein
MTITPDRDLLALNFMHAAADGIKNAMGSHRFCLFS